MGSRMLSEMANPPGGLGRKATKAPYALSPAPDRPGGTLINTVAVSEGPMVPVKFTKNAE